MERGGRARQVQARRREQQGEQDFSTSLQELRTARALTGVLMD